MDNRNENIRELIERFINADKAQKYLEDIEIGQRILSEHPAPEPDDMLLANIKANIALKAIPQSTGIFHRTSHKVLAVAASIAIIAVISLRSFNETPNIDPGMEIGTAGLPMIDDLWGPKDEVIAALGTLDTRLKNLQGRVKALDIGMREEEDYDAIALEEYENQIDQVKNNLALMEIANENYDEYENYNNSNIFQELKQRLESINNDFWENDYEDEDFFEEL